MNTTTIACNDIAALTAEYVVSLENGVKFRRNNNITDKQIKNCLASELKKIEARKAPVQEAALARHTAIIAAHKQVIASI